MQKTLKYTFAFWLTLTLFSKPRSSTADINFLTYNTEQKKNLRSLEIFWCNTKDRGTRLNSFRKNWNFDFHDRGVGVKRLSTIGSSTNAMFY